MNRLISKTLITEFENNKFDRKISSSTTSVLSPNVQNEN